MCIFYVIGSKVTTVRLKSQTGQYCWVDEAPQRKWLSVGAHLL